MDDHPRTGPATWAELVDARDGLVRELAAPVLDCVAREDTHHPAFHGCIDWHSSVHGTWALHVASRLLNDDVYLNAADAVLDPVSVAGELRALKENVGDWEIPYGYAWFLALARERENAGRDDLRPLADVAAVDLAAWLDGLDDVDLRSAILNDSYGNASWALLNLYEWAGHTSDAAGTEHWTALAESAWLPLGEGCPIRIESNRIQEFFPPCLHRAMVLNAVLHGAAREAWLTEVDTEGVPELAVVDEPVSAHGAGLNFSRAWGLHALWTATGDGRWQDLYVEHVVTHIARPEYWAEDYFAHAHWIPQFGIRALSLIEN